MIARDIALLTLALSLPSTAAFAQTPPSAKPTAAQIAAIGEFIKPTGVGGCIYYAVSTTVTRAAIVDVISTGNPLSPSLRQAVAQVAQRCTGQPYDASDTALVGTTLAAFLRAGTAIALAMDPAIGQRRLDAAWAEVSTDERTPFVATAAGYLAPGSAIPAAPPAAAVAPFEQRLGLDPTGQSAKTVGFLYRYYYATALGPRAEAILADRGAKPAAP